MDAQFAVLALVTARLDAAGIGYMLTGSMALTFYGDPRSTRDVDLVVAVEPSDADRLYALFSDEGDGAQQRRGIEMLIASVATLDWPYVERWAPQLGVADVLREARA